MDVQDALERVWQEAKRSSQGRVADRIGVQRSALSRWKQGESPQGELREKLIAWAESLPPRAAVAPEEAAIELANERTGQNLVRLAEIRGYAKSVLAMLRAVADEQQRVVDSLEPYAAAEGRLLATRLTAEDRREILEAVTATEAAITQPETARRPASEA
jgi:transcriptional regulator with XRE-family HTH domain